MSNFWFKRLAHIVPNHLNGAAPETVIEGPEEAAQVRGRSVVVMKLKPLPVEAVVRDYLETLDWNKTPPAPRLPREVIAKTSEKYREALYRLTGQRPGG